MSFRVAQGCGAASRGFFETADGVRHGAAVPGAASRRIADAQGIAFTAAPNIAAALGNAAPYHCSDRLLSAGGRAVALFLRRLLDRRRDLLAAIGAGDGGVELGHRAQPDRDRVARLDVRRVPMAAL